MASAFVLSGHVRDSKMAPLPFVTIHLKGTTLGSTTNMDGFYSLEIPRGSQSVVFQLIGYKVKEIQVMMLRDSVLDIVLADDAVQLKEVDVVPGKEDPAYAIIRNAMKKRESYLRQVKRYFCNVYIKGLQRIVRYPKKILGREINLNNVIDTATGIIYLSESVSDFYFEQPDKIREFLISSKVSGRNNAFSYNQESDMLFNFYQNLIQTGIAQRGIISPIAGTCMLSYNYKFAGSFFENGVWVNKIQVSPKRKSDPCFSGFIYICDSTWRIYNVDVFVTKENQIRFVDTLRISQVFLPVNDSVWMPFTNKFSFSFNVFGFQGNGYYTGIRSAYNLNPDVQKRFFNGEEWHVNDGSNKKNNSYWDSIRPIPLTREEITDYRKKDSLHQIWDSKSYKDSLDKRNNRLQPHALWEGYSWRSTWRGISVRTSPLLTGFLFNTVQGWNPSVNFYFNYRNAESKKEFQTQITPSYGISSGEFYLTGGMRYEYNPKKNARLELSGGKEAAQFNGANPISSFVNCLYTLLDKRNYLKLYQKDFFSFNWRVEPVNGITFFTSGELANRKSLQNTTDFSWVKRSYPYSENNPGETHTDSVLFVSGTKVELGAGIRFRPGQKYLMLPNEKINMRSKFPELTILYKKAIPGFAQSAVAYDFISCSVSDYLNLRRLGKGQFLIRAGKFFNANHLQFMDYKHFSGNQTYFSDFSFQKFQLLDYYGFSTADQFAEAWYSHNFGGFFFNSVPLLKKLKWEEVAVFRYAFTPELSHYTEYSVGVSYLLARFEWVWSRRLGETRNGVRFGFRF
jgi:hypothetical protein